MSIIGKRVLCRRKKTKKTPILTKATKKIEYIRIKGVCRFIIKTIFF